MKNPPYGKAGLKDPRPENGDTADDVFFDNADVMDIVAYERRGPRAGASGSFFEVLTRVARRKRFLLAAALVLLTVALYALQRQGYLTPESLLSFLRSHPLSAPLIFVSVYALLIMCLIPTLPLNLGAGMIWGPYWGAAVTLVSATAGATGAFLAARYLAAEPLNARFNNKAWLWLRQEIHRRDWKAVAFVRVNPVFPFGPASYFFGLTEIRFRNYFLATLIPIIPMCLVNAAIGHSIGSIVLDGDAYALFRNLLLVSLAISVFVVLKIIVRRDRK